MTFRAPKDYKPIFQDELEPEESLDELLELLEDELPAFYKILFLVFITISESIQLRYIVLACYNDI